MDKIDIKSMLLTELEECFLSMGEKKYRAVQVFSWIHKGIKSFDEMTDLPIELRNRLSEQFIITVPKILDKQVSKKDGTIKYLWSIGNDDTIESVLLEYHHGTAVCISSQVGCAMGCVFCASSIGGLIRNLTASEMLDQVYFSSLDTGRKISNIVVMGIGEPLNNFDNLIRFIELVSHPKGLNIGARHITVSTCGIVENIDRLAGCGVQLSLAISLHAPDDMTRTKLIAHNKHTGIQALFEAAKRYSDITGRRISFEYAMIDGINDSKEQARELSNLLKGTDYHLNLIILNKVSGRNFSPSPKVNINAFAEVLKKNGINFTTRRSLGTDIEAACGQLRRKSLKSNGCSGNN